MNGNHVILLKINNTFTNTLKLSKFFKYKMIIFTPLKIYLARRTISLCENETKYLIYKYLYIKC